MLLVVVPINPNLKKSYLSIFNSPQHCCVEFVRSVAVVVRRRRSRRPLTDAGPRCGAAAATAAVGGQNIRLQAVADCTGIWPPRVRVAQAARRPAGTLQLQRDKPAASSSSRGRRAP